MMPQKNLVLLVLLLCSLRSVNAQPGASHLNLKSRVLDIAFQSEITHKPYFSKLVLRYNGSPMQIVLVVHAGEEKYWERVCELSIYTLPEITEGGFGQFIAKQLAKTPNAQPEDIAAKLKVKYQHSTVECQSFDQALQELGKIRISPTLVDRVAVDEFSTYEYTYDNWQESVHYSLTGSSDDTPQDELVKWMIEFKKKILQKNLK